MKNTFGVGCEHDFYSGEGSHRLDIVQPYLEVVTKFLTSFQEKLTVCDLGCGDFNIGKELVPYTKQYIAVDIVDALIERNKKKFKDDRLAFHCLDIAVDPLPKADCIILRQVLQHLSNNEVAQVLQKVHQYKYIILTEHLPSGYFTPNTDIISGQGIRIKKKSGLAIEAPPFNFKASQEKVFAFIAFGKRFRRDKNEIVYYLIHIIPLKLDKTNLKLKLRGFIYYTMALLSFIIALFALKSSLLDPPGSFGFSLPEAILFLVLSILSFISVGKK